MPSHAERKWRQKSRKNPYGRVFRKSLKNIQKIGISGEKRYCRKGVSGIPESVKNSVLKAISDEMQGFDSISPQNKIKTKNLKSLIIDCFYRFLNSI